MCAVPVTWAWNRGKEGIQIAGVPALWVVLAREKSSHGRGQGESNAAGPHVLGAAGHPKSFGEVLVTMDSPRHNARKCSSLHAERCCHQRVISKHEGSMGPLHMLENRKGGNWQTG